MKNKFLSFWIFFHSAIFIAFIISIVVSPEISFGTSLFEIMPPSSSLHEVQKADNLLGDKTSREFTILTKARNFEDAKTAAERFYAHYNDTPARAEKSYFDSLSLYVNSSSVSEITEYLHENRFFLLSDNDINLLENENAKEIANDALSSVYGAFSISDLAFLDEDPFLLSERSLKKNLEDGAVSATSMSLKDNVLACQKDDLWYVLIRGTVSEKGSAMASKQNAVKSIYETADEICRPADIQFIFSGVPFHSYENSSSAQAQISIISSVSLILIILVFLWIFRSFVPAIASALAVAFSCGVGFISVLLFFRGIHVLTFVFGTTLIGTCLDYSIHYFINWKANLSCENGIAVRKHIFRGITFGFISTEICFAALFLGPFPLLKQVSVFLFFGLASSYLSVVALYPLIKMPKSRGAILFSKSDNNKSFEKVLNISKKILHFLPILLTILSLLTILINRRSFKIQNSINELYSMSGQMQENEITSANVLNTGSSGWYFILKSDSEENLLQKDEELSAFLSECVGQKKLGNFLSVSQFIPSKEKQEKSYKAAEKLLPFAEEQFEALGFEDSPALAKNYEQNYRSSRPNNTLPPEIQEAISNLWIGEVDGEFYSCVMPLHASREDEHFFREYAQNHNGIYFVNKVSDISSQLDILSKTMLKMLALAFIAVIVILSFFYKMSLVLKIASVPLLVTLVTTAVLLIAKIKLSFFPITALVLVFGLGLDYIIYAIEGKEKLQEKQNLNNFAILLSFITTALSFGALSLSTFPPVHMLGLTVFAGLVTAVITAFSD